MRFFLGDTDAPHDLDEQRRRWDAYQQYLRSIAGRLPPGALAFAAAPWHYDPSDHRCPHDAWVESVTVLEPAKGERQERRGLELRVRLLGAYHDGHIQLTYRDVRGYALSAPAEAARPRPGIGHGDWLIDEVRLSEHELAAHEIMFERGHWLIECADLEYLWLPLQSAA